MNVADPLFGVVLEVYNQPRKAALNLFLVTVQYFIGYLGN